MSNFFSNKARAAAAAAATTNGTSSTAKAPDTRLQPWVEKYRPKTLDDVAAQDHTINVLQRTLQASNLPHMLFYGPPGTGKTSTILALAKQLYGPAMFSSRVLELNASDERGIAIVREKVKDFARQQLSNPPGGSYRATYPCPPYKIIVLDEADSMTQDAQSALRRTMETYSRITRFCLVCNYVTRIIDPLASRCSKFRFKSLASGHAEERLRDIARAEHVRLADGAATALVRCADGDLRKAITCLQSASRLAAAEARAGTAGDDDDNDDDEDADMEDAAQPLVTVQSVEDIAGVIPQPVVDALWTAMQPPARGGGSVYPAVASSVEAMVADGWSGAQVVSQLFQKALHDDVAASNAAKVRMTLVFAEVDKRLVDGADEHLAILDLALRVAGILARGK